MTSEEVADVIASTLIPGVQWWKMSGYLGDQIVSGCREIACRIIGIDDLDVKVGVKVDPSDEDFSTAYIAIQAGEEDPLGFYVLVDCDATTGEPRNAVARINRQALIDAGAIPGDDILPFPLGRIIIPGGK